VRLGGEKVSQKNFRIGTVERKNQFPLKKMERWRETARGRNIFQTKKDLIGMPLRGKGN